MDINSTSVESCFLDNIAKCNNDTIKLLLTNFEKILIPKAIILLSLGVLAVIGNGLLVYIIVSTPRLRTKSNTFVVALAITDFAIGFPGIPLHCTAEMGLLGR